jgi:hypothetical protein
MLFPQVPYLKRRITHNTKVYPDIFRGRGGGRFKEMALRIFTDIETLPPGEYLRTQLSPSVICKSLKKRPQKETCEDGQCTEEFRALALHREYRLQDCEIIRAVYYARWS